MLIRKRILKVLLNGGWVAASQVFRMGVGLLTLPVLLWYYGRENYGLIAIVVSVQMYLGILSLRTPDGLVKHAAEWLHRRSTQELHACARTAFTFYAAQGVVSAVVLTIIGIFCDGLFHVPAAESALLRNMFFLTAGTVLLLSPTQLITQLLKAAEEFEFMSKCAIIQSALELVWTLGAAHWQVRLDYFLAIRLLIPLFTLPFFVNRWSRHGSIGGVCAFGWHWKAFGPVIKYGCAWLAMDWSLTTFLQLRQMLLGARSSVGAVAEFSIVLAITNALMTAGSWIVGPLIPSVAKAVAGGEGEYVEFIAYRMTKYFGLLLCFPAICVIVDAEPILKLYVGQQFVGLAPWLAVMMLCVVDAFLAPLSGIIFASGKLRPFVWSNGIFGMLGVAMVWLLAPRFGGMSAVLATLWYFAANYVFHLLYYIPRVMALDSWRVFRESFIKTVLPGALTAGVMAGIKTAFNAGSDLEKIVVTVALGIPCYLVLVWLISFDNSERAIAHRVLTLRPGRRRIANATRSSDRRAINGDSDGERMDRL